MPGMAARRLRWRPGQSAAGRGGAAAGFAMMRDPQPVGPAGAGGDAGAGPPVGSGGCRGRGCSSRRSGWPTRVSGVAAAVRAAGGKGACRSGGQAYFFDAAGRPWSVGHRLPGAATRRWLTATRRIATGGAEVLHPLCRRVAGGGRCGMRCRRPAGRRGRRPRPARHIAICWRMAAAPRGAVPAVPDLRQPGGRAFRRPGSDATTVRRRRSASGAPAGRGEALAGGSVAFAHHVCRGDSRLGYADRAGIGAGRRSGPRPGAGRRCWIALSRPARGRRPGERAGALRRPSGLALRRGRRGGWLGERPSTSHLPSSMQPATGWR